MTPTDLRDAGSFRLISGMGVTAEIKTGERTIVSAAVLTKAIREPSV